MRLIVMEAHADTVGTDTAELFEFPADTTDKDLQRYAEDFGQNHWDMYDASETEDESDEYYQACDAWWRPYDPDKDEWMLPAQRP